MKTLLILLAIATSSCGQSPLPEEFREGNLLEGEVKEQVENIMKQYYCLSGKFKPLDIKYNPTSDHCLSNPDVMAYNSKWTWVKSKVEVNLITYCVNPEDLDYFTLQALTLHELHHAIAGIREHVEGKMSIFNSHMLPVSYYIRHRTGLLMDLFDVDSKKVKECVN